MLVVVVVVPVDVVIVIGSTCKKTSITKARSRLAGVSQIRRPKCRSFRVERAVYQLRNPVGAST